MNNWKRIEIIAWLERFMDFRTCKSITYFFSWTSFGVYFILGASISFLVERVHEKKLSQFQSQSFTRKFLQNCNICQNLFFFFYWKLNVQDNIYAYILEKLHFFFFWQKLSLKVNVAWSFCPKTGGTWVKFTRSALHKS